MGCPCCPESSLSPSTSYWLASLHRYVLVVTFLWLHLHFLWPLIFSVALPVYQKMTLEKGVSVPCPRGCPASNTSGGSSEYQGAGGCQAERGWFGVWLCQGGSAADGAGAIFPASSDIVPSVFFLPAASAWNSVESLMMLQNHFLAASNNALP